MNNKDKKEDLYPDEDDIPEFDPEAIVENEDNVEDPVEGEEFDEFNEENADDIEEIEDNVSDPEEGLDSLEEIPEGINQADIGVDEEGDEDLEGEIDELD